MQALCKAFALDFNGVLDIEPPLDFVVTHCIQRKSETRFGTGDGFLLLEPYLTGDYVKYNSNAAYVNEELADHPSNLWAQAFSHFTFERSRGRFLVNDLQGIGLVLINPAIQTWDRERFKLTETNLNEEGFKFFPATHECNSVCHSLGLKSNKQMVVSGNFEFREAWPTINPTVCCSNKMCRRIVRRANS